MEINKQINIDDFQQISLLMIKRKKTWDEGILPQYIVYILNRQQIKEPS